MSELLSQIDNFIKQGRYLEAHNITNHALLNDPENLKLKQLFALSMAKSGGLEEAEAYLQPIWEQNKSDAETSGILGGIYKGIFKKTESSKYALLSRDIYLNNFQSTADYYTGINAATMSVIIGESSKGKDIASQVLTSLPSQSSDVWTEATKAEAHFLMKNFDDAKAGYTTTRDMAANNWGQVNSIYQQLWLLNHYRQVPSEILNIFKPPVIAAFAGHMVDGDNRKKERFPEDIVPEVTAEIASNIKRLNIKIGYSSLACGGDILFVEEMLRQGNEVNICLPFDLDDFVNTSVAFANGDWVERFNAIVNNRDIKFITREHYLNDDVLFALQGKVIFGSSILRGATFNAVPYLLTVLAESDTQRSVGGTRALSELWPYKESLITINPDSYRDVAQEITNSSSEEDNTSEPSDKLNRNIFCLLYADVVGYNQIEEGEIPYFAHKIWGEIADNYDDLLIQPTSLNIWGGRLSCVFNSTRSTIEFALYLKNIVDKFDWGKEGLQHGIDLKLALHIGPAYFGTNPLTKQDNAYGSHINRTSEMLNVAIPGAIYASEQFSAVLALESDNYQFDHVGVVELNENLGAQEIYKISQKD